MRKGTTIAGGVVLAALLGYGACQGIRSLEKRRQYVDGLETTITGTRTVLNDYGNGRVDGFTYDPAGALNAETGKLARAAELLQGQRDAHQAELKLIDEALAVSDKKMHGIDWEGKKLARAPKVAQLGEYARAKEAQAANLGAQLRQMERRGDNYRGLLEALDKGKDHAVYTIRHGGTLHDVAEQYGGLMTESELAAANPNLRTGKNYGPGTGVRVPVDRFLLQEFIGRASALNAVSAYAMLNDAYQATSDALRGDHSLQGKEAALITLLDVAIGNAKSFLQEQRRNINRARELAGEGSRLFTDAASHANEIAGIITRAQDRRDLLAEKVADSRKIAEQERADEFAYKQTRRLEIVDQLKIAGKTLAEHYRDNGLTYDGSKPVHLNWDELDGRRIAKECGAFRLALHTMPTYNQIGDELVTGLGGEVRLSSRPVRPGFQNAREGQGSKTIDEVANEGRRLALNHRRTGVPLRGTGGLDAYIDTLPNQYALVDADTNTVIATFSVRKNKTFVRGFLEVAGIAAAGGLAEAAFDLEGGAEVVEEAAAAPPRPGSGIEP